MAYATVDDVRRFLGLPDEMASKDDEIAAALDAAIESVDSYCGRSFTPVADDAEPSVRIFDGGTCRVLIDDATEVTVIEESSDRQSWSTIDATSWWTEPANSTPKNAVVSGTPLAPFVRVTATWGHAATTPASVHRATVMLAARLFKRKDSATGVEGFADFGVVRVSNRTDPDIAMLLAPHRRADVVFGLA